MLAEPLVVERRNLKESRLGPFAMRASRAATAVCDRDCSHRAVSLARASHRGSATTNLKSDLSATARHPEFNLPIRIVSHDLV